MQAWDATTGSPVQKAWPWWVYIIIVLLIGMSILWIPFVALLRACGVTLLKREKAAWFPAEELRDDNNVQPHKVETDDNNDML